MATSYSQNRNFMCQGGTWYVCPQSQGGFVGCCAQDPCRANTTTPCPAGFLYPATMKTDMYSNIVANGCFNSASLWYTCTNPPFLGCCANSYNPCSSKAVCSGDNLTAARWSETAGSGMQGQVFLDGASFLSSSSSSPTSTATTTPTSISTSEPVVTGKSSHGISTGAIIGIAVGAGIVILLLVAVLMYKCGWDARRKKHKVDAPTTDPMTTSLAVTSPTLTDNRSNSTYSPYKDSHSFPNSPSPQHWHPAGVQTNYPSPHHNHHTHSFISDPSRDSQYTDNQSHQGLNVVGLPHERYYAELDGNYGHPELYGSSPTQAHTPK